MHYVARPSLDELWSMGRELDDDRKRERRERTVSAILGVVTALVLVVWMAWSMTADRRAIARLPDAQRRVIFEHTLTSVRALCAEPEDAVIQRRCREQAEFLLAFPECDADCRAVVGPLTRKPTR